MVMLWSVAVIISNFYSREPTAGWLCGLQLLKLETVAVNANEKRELKRRITSMVPREHATMDLNRTVFPAFVWRCASSFGTSQFLFQDQRMFSIFMCSFVGQLPCEFSQPG